MAEILFIAIAILVGVVFGYALDFIVRSGVKKQLNADKNQENCISEEHIQECICIKDGGHSIDTVVCNLKAHNIVPKFQLNIKMSD